MRSSSSLLLAAAATVSATSLADVCTVDHVTASLPADGTFQGITIDAASVTAAAVYNATASSVFFPSGTFDYCNVTMQYAHDGKDDTVIVQYWMPAPASFQNRFLATGGGAYAISSAANSLPGGLVYGAAAGTTDGGFGSFSTDFDSVFLEANGTINWDLVYMFGYQAIGEMTEIGKTFTASYFGVDNSTSGATNSSKVYTYYQGCSEGGREGWSQVQHNPTLWDGVIAGAPAFRYGQQQVNHLYSNVVEQTLGYYPSTCEFETILNATISACDALDGKVDGVVARTDLCKLQFNLNSTIGQSYYCAASSAGSSLGLGVGQKVKRQSSSIPEQNGTITAEAVAVAAQIIDGLHDTDGKRAYLSYQPTAAFEDGATTYNADTGDWELSIAGAGGEWVVRFLELTSASNLDSLDGVTYDTLRDWMREGWYRYQDSLQTNNPDLTDYLSNGGKIIHFHGESDPSIPTASSAHYYESVRSVMYPDTSYNDSITAINDWYRFYIVPGAAHCTTNTLQPNGPFPDTNLGVMIQWVEQGIVPTTLNATILQGDYEGQNEQICSFPLRPLWTDNSTLTCVYDQASIDAWTYSFPAYKLPLY